MPFLESLQLIQILYGSRKPSRRRVDPVVDVPSAHALGFPQLKRLLMEDCLIPQGSTILLLKRTPSLTDLTLTWGLMQFNDVHDIMKALVVLSENEGLAACGPVICPHLQHMQILVPELRWLCDLEERVSGALKDLQETRLVFESRVKLGYGHFRGPNRNQTTVIFLDFAVTYNHQRLLDLIYDVYDKQNTLDGLGKAVDKDLPMLVMAVGRGLPADQTEVGDRGTVRPRSDSLHLHEQLSSLVVQFEGIGRQGVPKPRMLYSDSDPMSDPAIRTGFDPPHPLMDPYIATNAGTILWHWSVILCINITPYSVSMIHHKE
ncbi:hypothetical protein SISNIDRAFT_469919 [Sistotremastrum niveocremeum HHB9708]|uniref:Uncharacterized protein n=1 Tax=Sistotremastrum niveocremeum HHB9708 TaxID=1314777 RepID=A0A164PE89_9AGAM|nr:hypothetical protein SISNIDRAFT_469919 [Sistotremastrum niveocremeum HHB9708]